jgi:hypothetical protein
MIAFPCGKAIIRKYHDLLAIYGIVYQVFALPIGKAKGSS